MIKSLHEFLQKNLVEKIFLVLFNGERILEKFVFIFQLESLKSVKFDFIHLKMKDFFLKLNILEMKKLPQDNLTFKLQLSTKELQSEIIPNEWSLNEDPQGMNSKIKPIKSMIHEESGMKLEFYIQF
jgi:hypothetical protein